ncbi:MAG: 4-oxalocrotonate tautomerase family protein [Alphaproteobacteria bacterium]
MPFVSIRMVKGRPPAQKDEIARRVAGAVHEVTGLPTEAVWVVFEDVEAADWYVGERSVEELRKGRT